MHNTPALRVLLQSALILSALGTAKAAPVVAAQNSTGTPFASTPWAAQLSATDLINAGRLTLESATVSTSTFGPAGTNNGSGAGASTTENTYFATANLPATATYNLNLVHSPAGYDLTAIRTFMGWTANSSLHANQLYSVEVSVVGDSGYTPLVTVAHAPFAGVDSADHESFVEITDSAAGLLATGVDSIRFSFANPGTGGNSPGTVVREVDVVGTPTGALPVATVQSSNGTPAFASTPWAPQLSASDLINAGQSSLLGATVTTAQFGAGGINNGTSGAGTTPDNTYFNTSQFPAVATYTLNTTGNPAGYVITSIQSFMGWHANSALHGNQNYTVAVRLAGSSTFIDLTSVAYSPFTGVDSTHHESHVRIDRAGGPLVSGVDAIRFTLTSPGSGGTAPGTVVREIDVHGYPAGGGPGSSVAISRPRSREVFQRTSTGTGTVAVSGTYQGTPDSLEARLVRMTGAANTGAGTDWRTLVTAPSGGAFTGSIPNAPAGGWYQLEVRAITAGTPGATAMVSRVGIGDIFLTCGQSNSANYGAPAAAAADDRVSAWDYASGNWSAAADPMPGAGGSGGSAWPRLGDLLAAQNQVPVAFVCLGVGSSSAASWTPPSGGNYARLSTAVRAFPANGFRAILWHQGETDSINATTPAQYETMLQTILAQSRVDAGWTAPWYLAEASFHPSSSLANEERVVAGQRRVFHGDPAAFPGAVTDDFHLEGKLSDSVHFNAAGLADHAAQWAQIFGGVPPVAPKNGDFEANAALADGGIAVTNPALATSLSIPGWRALGNDGESSADGAFGLYNPSAAFYPLADDAAPSAGIVPGMTGRHAAFLFDSTAGAHFLQTRRASRMGGHTCTFTAALGVRANGDTFGGATLELLADGVPVATRTVTRADLDALQGGNAAGTFTDVSLIHTAPTVVPTAQPLALRVRKNGGAGTYLDVDNARLTQVASPFASWQVDHFGSTDHPDAAAGADPDHDGADNESEFRAGTSPVSATSALRVRAVEVSGDDLRISWNAAGTRTNVLQMAATPRGADFSDLSGAIVVPGPGDATPHYIWPNAATNAGPWYFRVRLQE